MDWNEVGYAAVAAAFGYVATFGFKRHEVVRAVGLDIDEQLLRALAVAESQHDQVTDMLDEVQRVLRAAQLRVVALPSRQKKRVDQQLSVVEEVLWCLYAHTSREDAMFKHYVQAAITAAREEVANLLLPPPFLFRRQAQPTKFPTPNEFRTIMNRNRDEPLKGLEEALKPYRETVLATAD
jgi:hypothetical protein